MINIVHDIMLLLDCSNFVLDYLFYLLPNFEFQKPITLSLDTIFEIADDLVKNMFFVAAKRKFLLFIRKENSFYY